MISRLPGSLMEITCSSAKGELQTLCSWVELGSSFGQVVSYRSKVHSIYTAEPDAAVRRPRPVHNILGSYVNVRQNHADSSHIHSLDIYWATAICQALPSTMGRKDLQIFAFMDVAYGNYFSPDNIY